MTRVHVIAGFLGAGKTTVLRHLLARRPAGEKVAVVVNDFGEAAVDAALLGGDGRGLREIQGACVCCTAPEGFVAAVRDLLEADRLFVEPTGIARPEDVLDTLRRAPFADRLSVGPLVVVVDPRRITHAGEVADVVVANRTDLATPDDLAAFRAWAAALWPGPLRVIETAHGVVPDDVLDWAPGAGPRAVPHHHDHDHDHGFVARSWVWPPDVVFHRGRLHAALAELPLARAKGLFRTDDGFLDLQRAADAVHEAPTAWRRDSRADAIAADPSVLDRLGERLDEARFAPDELRARGTTVEVAWEGGLRTFDRSALAALGGVPDVGALFPKRAGRAARLPDLLAAAGAPAEGRIVVVARDGYASAPVDVGAVQGGLLVHSLGDGPLPDDQGGPFRLLVPSEVACANVKGVVRVRILR